MQTIKHIENVHYIAINLNYMHTQSLNANPNPITTFSGLMSATTKAQIYTSHQPYVQPWTSVSIRTE